MIHNTQHNTTLSHGPSAYTQRVLHKVPENSQNDTKKLTTPRGHCWWALGSVFAILVGYIGGDLKGWFPQNWYFTHVLLTTQSLLCGFRFSWYSQIHVTVLEFHGRRECLFQTLQHTRNKKVSENFNTGDRMLAAHGSCLGGFNHGVNSTVLSQNGMPHLSGHLGDTAQAVWRHDMRHFLLFDHRRPNSFLRWNSRTVTCIRGCHKSLNPQSGEQLMGWNTNCWTNCLFNM